MKQKESTWDFWAAKILKSDKNRTFPPKTAAADALSSQMFTEFC